MTIIDFLIGLTLMNAMPHFVLGAWGARMLSGFGFGNLKNMAYGLLNFIISISLYIYHYGIEHLLNNGIYLGAITMLIIYFATSRFLKNLFAEKNN